MDFLAAAVGILGVVLLVLSYQQKTRTGILICNIIARSLFILQYVLLFAFEGMALDLVGVAGSLLAQKKEKPFIKKTYRCCNLDCQCTDRWSRIHDVPEFVQHSANPGGDVPDQCPVVQQGDPCSSAFPGSCTFLACLQYLCPCLRFCCRGSAVLILPCHRAAAL